MIDASTPLSRFSIDMTCTNSGFVETELSLLRVDEALQVFDCVLRVFHAFRGAALAAHEINPEALILET